MHQTQDWAQLCFVGDKPSACWLALFSDASFAGDLRDSKSTTGGSVCLVGPTTFVPLSWICKKQGAVSHSSTEAEIIALDTMMWLEGLPYLNLWSQLMDSYTGRDPARSERSSDTKPSAYKKYDAISLEYCDWVPPSLPPLSPYGAKLYFVEDNDAVIKMVIKGRSANMKHVARTHLCNLDWLFL